MKKLVQARQELFIQFTEEEIAELGFKEGEKLYIKANDDGSITLSRGSALELDLSEFSRDTLEALIKRSCETNKSVPDLIEESLEWSINNQDIIRSQLEKENEAKKDVLDDGPIDESNARDPHG